MITTGAAAKPIPILRRRSERLFCGVVESVLDTGLLLLLLLLVVVVASFSFRSSVRERRIISCRSLVLACTRSCGSMQESTGGIRSSSAGGEVK